MTSLRRDVNLVSIHEVVQTRPAFFRVCFSMLTVFVFLPAVILISGPRRAEKWVFGTLVVRGPCNQREEETVAVDCRG